MPMITYLKDDGTSATVGIDRFRSYKSGKRKGKIFFRNLYTLVGIRYGIDTIIFKENMTFIELIKYKSKMKIFHY